MFYMSCRQTINPILNRFMKAIIQRVISAMVEVDERIVGKIDLGILVYLGIIQNDEPKQADALAEKIVNFRIFPDEHGRMNRSLLEIRGKILVISQFTLAADGKKGNRPSFDLAATPSVALPLYERFIFKIQELGITTQTGIFGASMKVTSTNDGPVTFILEK